MIYPNGILPAPPIPLLLHHLRHLGDLRSPPIRRRLCVGHHDNEGQPDTTDKPRCCCSFLCTPDTLYVKLLLVLLRLLLRGLRTWWPCRPAMQKAVGPRATRTRTRRGTCCLFGRNTANVDGQRLSFNHISYGPYMGRGWRQRQTGVWEGERGKETGSWGNVERAGDLHSTKTHCGGGVLPVPFFLTWFVTNPHLPQFRHAPIRASAIVEFW
jgi:hypothetical protein